MIYDVFTLGTDNSYITFNDETNPDYYIRAKRRVFGQRDVRQFDTVVPDEMGIVDYQTLIGKGLFVIEGKIYPISGNTGLYKAEELLRKVCNPKIAQDDADSDTGYVLLKWTEDEGKQLRVKPLYVDIPEQSKSANTPTFKMVLKVRYPFVEAQSASQVTLSPVITSGGGLVIPGNLIGYPESNVDGYTNMYTGSVVGTGQSIAGLTGDTTQLRFYLKKTGAPTGNIIVNLYQHSGTFGTSSVPGTLIGQIGTIDSASLSTTAALVDMVQTNVRTLATGTNYIVTLEYSGGSASNYVMVGYDGSAPIAPGNYMTKTGSTWTADATKDMGHYVFVTGGLIIPAGGVQIGADSGGASQAVHNAGDYRAYPTINFYGTMVNPKLTNTSTGKYIEFAFNLNQGNINVTTDYDGATAIHSDGTNLLQYLTAGSDIDAFFIEPGENALSLTASTMGSNASVVINHRDVWPLS